MASLLSVYETPRATKVAEALGAQNRNTHAYGGIGVEYGKLKDSSNGSDRGDWWECGSLEG